MPIFILSISESLTRDAEIEVEAPNAQAARRMAREQFAAAVHAGNVNEYPESFEVEVVGESEEEEE